MKICIIDEKYIQFRAWLLLHKLLQRNPRLMEPHSGLRQRLHAVLQRRDVALQLLIEALQLLRRKRSQVHPPPLCHFVKAAAVLTGWALGAWASDGREFCTKRKTTEPGRHKKKRQSASTYGPTRAVPTSGGCEA